MSSNKSNQSTERPASSSGKVRRDKSAKVGGCDAKGKKKFGSPY
jgi:hypothetical protein